MGEQATALERRIWIRIWLANLAGVIPINLYLTIASEQFEQKIELNWAYATLPAIVYAPAYIWSRLRSKQLFAPIAAWVDEQRTPTAHERAATIDHPRRLALMSLSCWIWALLCSYVAAIVIFEPLRWQYAALTATVSLSAIIACSLTYLVAEDALRPSFARVLTEETTKRSSVGIMPRLTLTWMIGSGSYFISIAILALAVRPESLPLYVIGACTFGILVGALLTRTGAGSVARPLNDVRTAIEKVAAGDLDASVTVDDAGEVGQLQAGFNRMVAGLRERDRLKQLFDRHVGRDVAERAVDATGLAGVELEASVMFVDVIGSTTLAAERRPEAVLAMLNSLFDAVVRTVTAEGGLVNQFQGDGALCIFGAPQESADHAARALRAASALRREIVRLGETFPGFDAAIGLSSGRVVGGDVGSEDRYEYTVIGDAANEAKRLTDHAKQRPSRLLASGHTIGSAGLDHGWHECGDIALRGRPTLTRAFEPAGGL